MLVIFCVCDWSSSAVTVVANLNAFSEPFFKNGRSLGVAVDDDDDATDDAGAVVLSTFPWDSFRSGGGNHLRLQSNFK